MYIYIYVYVYYIYILYILRHMRIGCTEAPNKPGRTGAGLVAGESQENARPAVSHRREAVGRYVTIDETRFAMTYIYICIWLLLWNMNFIFNSWDDDPI